MFRAAQLLSVLCLCTMLLPAGCSRPAPPPPPPPPPPAAALPEAKPQDEQLSRDERIAAIARDKFSLYERKIMVADFPRAEAALRDLRAVYELEVDYKLFWEKSIPPAKRMTLALMSLCETCRDGLCPLCKGASKCNVCGGDGKCKTCAGSPVREVACKACICSSCSGTGKCRTCSGFQSKKCEACQGYGTAGGTTQVSCRRCGGSGTVAGLKGPQGSSALRCLTCSGRGTVQQRTLNMCANCQGKGSLPCPGCAGSGRCAVCSGAGKNASCPSCEGKGAVVFKCPQCGGDGSCVKCQATGQCTSCHGSGKCFECDGGLVKLYEFPVNADWLTMKDGYVLFDSRLDKIAIQSNVTGYCEIAYQDLQLSLIVNRGQLVFISTQPAFDPASAIIRK